MNGTQKQKYLHIILNTMKRLFLIIILATAVSITNAYVITFTI